MIAHYRLDAANNREVAPKMNFIYQNFSNQYLYFHKTRSFSVIQIYRVSDMELVRVLPSAEDEVNVACFHPSVGSGLVYGTKVST